MGGETGRREGLMHKGIGFEGKVKGWGGSSGGGGGCWEKKVEGVKCEDRDTVLFEKLIAELLLFQLA